METLIIVAIGVMVAGFVWIGLTLRLRKDEVDKLDPEKFLAQLYEKSEELREKNKDEVNSAVKEMLEGNKKQIDLIIRELRDQIKDGQEKTESLAKQSTSIEKQLKQSNDLAKELHTSTEGLKNLLANNRLRGEWGERVAEQLLIGAGFVEKVHYLKQKATKDSRPDYTILLPDGEKLNIDVKFAYDHLQAYQNATSDIDRKKHLKNFETSIKNKIKEITSRDYINPEAGTLDFVIMFIPNEMIFSFIYEKLPNIIDLSTKKRVMMTGPFGFTALLRLVLQSYKNFRYERGLRNILGLIDKFREEYAKFGEKMEVLGQQIERTKKTYHEVEGTRSRALTRVVDKIDDYSGKEEILKMPKIEEEKEEPKE